jgi:hypothetical protein
MAESNFVRRRREILADTVERLELPLEVVLAPVPPPTVPWRIWKTERDALQAALEDLRWALCPGIRPVRAARSR